MIVYAEGDTPALEAEARWMIFQVLSSAYPGHPWWVRAYEGGFFIRHMDFDGNWGMNCPDQRKLYSASSYKKLVIMMAGEWLERANLKRGRADEDPTQHVECVPEKYQKKPPLLVEDVVFASGETPHRPEVIHAAEQIARSENVG